VASAAQFQKVKNIVQMDERRKIVVVSAPGKREKSETKLTDLLYSTHDLALKHLDISEPWSLIRGRYLQIVSDLGLPPHVEEDLDALEIQLREHPETVTADYLVSRGEYLCAKVMADYLATSLDAVFVDSFPLIEFDSLYRVTDASYQKLAAALSDPSKTYVMPGFYGSSTLGELKTFTRGGSDITGAVLANAIDAALYENWTDVSGLLMADPRIVENPSSIGYVSYREIRELAYSGASVLHDEAIAPCRAKNIKINIRNTNCPEAEGTFIGPTPETTARTVTGIAGRKEFSMVYIEKSMMNKERGFGRKVLGILEDHNISYELSPCGIDSMSIVVDTVSLRGVEEEVRSALEREMRPNKIKIFGGIALIATVGHGMFNQVGTAARLFAALAKAKVNVRIIDQGSSQINIMVGVDESDYEHAIGAIYKEFA
jgi:aspartate kinase